MKILRIKAIGLKQFEDGTIIDFFARQKVLAKYSDMLHQLTPQLYQNNSLAFVGINASGKTTTLKLLCFVMSILKNEPINARHNIIFLENNITQNTAIFEVTFIANKKVYQLTSTIERSKDLENNGFYFLNETLKSKKINKSNLKGALLDFTHVELTEVRDQSEVYLSDDISIIIALNKKLESKLVNMDLINQTDFNIMNVLGDFPPELIQLFDPSVEYLNANVENDSKDLEVRLKFKNDEEHMLLSRLELSHVLSSGTIKGLNIFARLKNIFRTGGYLIIDEIENHFNRTLVTSLINLFNDNQINPLGAMLIFSTHYPELLDDLDRSDSIYVLHHDKQIIVQNYSELVSRNDLKRSDLYHSGSLGNTAPSYEALMRFKAVLKR